MFKVLDIINEIKNESSKNGKQAILERNKDNELLKEVLYFVFNNFIVSGTSTKKLKKQVSLRGFNKIGNLMEYLKENNTGTDLDIISIQTYIMQQPEELRELYEQIATKDLKIGMSAKSINKVLGKGFIPEFSCQLAKKYQDHKDKIKGDFIISQKLDGSRLLVIKENGKVNSFTRTGKPYIGLVDIENEIKNLEIDNMVFDGELLSDVEGSTGAIFVDTIKKTRTKEKHKIGILFNIFDLIPLQEFKEGKSKDKAIKRKENLINLFKSSEFKYCKLVENLYVGSDVTAIKVWEEEAAKRKWEGIMLNRNMPYTCSRTDALLKVKATQSCDLEITGFEEGQGKYNGMLGSLIVDFKGNSVGVGTGLSDEDRQHIWENRSEYLGRVCEISYFEISKDKTGKESLRFPSFKMIREQEKEVSYY